MDAKPDMRYLARIPRKLAKGRVLVHNRVVPQPELGLNGFTPWTERLNADLELCPCNWAGVDLGGRPHYRVKRARKAAGAGK